MAVNKADKKTEKYGDSSITALKGADRVRKRPGVIFGSDGLDGCEHSFFEILSNSVDEAKEGHGSVIKVTYFLDKSIEVDDHGRGIPLGYNEKEKRWNWDLIFCELYAGGKYDNNSGGSSYEFSLGLNGLGACATQYSSEYMTVLSYDGEFKRTMKFKKGNPVGKLTEEPLDKKNQRTGTVIRWRPDIEVFTDIDIPHEFFSDILHFSDDLIDYLLQYCVERGKKDFRYIEKVAIAWAEANVTTPAEAQGHASRYDRTVYAVMNALGKTSAPTKSEVTYIMRWTREYGFDTEIILEACGRTVLATDRHRFAYADSILTAWHKAGVHHAADISGLDASYQKEKASKPARPASAAEYNRFMHNNYDFDAIEKELLKN